MSTTERPRVTVVIPARNEEASLDACLRSIRSQTEQSLQILVVDGDSDDGTADLVRRHIAEDDRVELLHNPQRTVPYSLNVALRAATAENLVRVDAHAAVPPDYVARAAELLETRRWGGVGGVKRGVGRTRAGKAIAAAMASRFGVGGSVYHYGTEPQEVDHVPFGAYPVALAREVGGWGEQFTVNQDFEFDQRIRQSGNPILFDPSLVIDWECRQHIGDLFKQYRRYGKGKVKVALTHPGSVRLRHLAAPALVASAAVGAAVLVTGAVDRKWVALAAAPYPTALLAASLLTASEVEDPAARPYLPAAFAAMHVGWGLGFWEGVRDAVSRRDT
ncbi:glycosyltransferase [Nocardioides sp. HDW12B]|uniref:glycosyltransferase n=1 Tax=Nocardioides sp. HDW12B TaxID=2714939 RepID=UPI00140D8304|nr:glycosyltransferase [Nocardioides sp. HDW12B]QIK68261.1 glycosyltransferase [Nocardioides sp. HDW12B]